MSPAISCLLSRRGGSSLLAKPSGCHGCPFYGDGRGFVPDLIHQQSPVLVYGQNPGASEEAQGEPFVGDTGAMMERKYLKLAGLTRDDISLGNAIRCRYNHKNDLPPLNQTIVRDALEHCKKAHFKVPEAARVIVSQGDYALYSLTGERSSTDWRGYALQLHGQGHLSSVWAPSVSGDIAVLATVHLARLFRDPTLTLATMSDWAKVSRLLKRTWPVSPPEFSLECPEAWPAAFAFDTEFTQGTGRLIRYSLAYRGTPGPVVHVVEAEDHLRPFFPPSRPRVVSQYAAADVRHLMTLSGSGERVWDNFLIDDSIWKHACLYSDHPHDLNYLGSIYSSMNRWKHLSDVEPQLYAGADAWGLWEIDEALEKEFSRDPRSRKVYEDIDRPTLKTFIGAQYRGLRVNQKRLQEVVTALEGDKKDAERRAVAAVGWPIKLGSVGPNGQIPHWLYNVEKLGRASKK